VQVLLLSRGLGVLEGRKQTESRQRDSVNVCASNSDVELENVQHQDYPHHFDNASINSGSNRSADRPQYWSRKAGAEALRMDRGQNA